MRDNSPNSSSVNGEEREVYPNGFTVIDNRLIDSGIFGALNTAQGVYIYIKRWCKADGTTLPIGTKRACKDLGISSSKFWRAIRKLKNMGLVETHVAGGGKLATIFKVLSYPHCNREVGSTHCNDEVAPTAPVTRPPLQPCSDTHCTGEVPQIHIANTSSKTNAKTNAGAAAGDQIPNELDTSEFKQAWAEWKQHRCETKKKLTPSTSKAQLKKLAAWGEKRAIVAIRHSIENGWQGIFEPNHDNPRRNHGSDSNRQPRGGEFAEEIDVSAVTVGD